MRFGSIVQDNWDWRAAGNFILGGTGSSMMFMTAATTFPENPPYLLGLVSLAVVAAGLGLVWLEIGRPWRFLNVFFHPGASWMTREAGVAVILFALAFLGLVLRQPLVIALAGLAGLGFLFCQAMMLKASKGIPAWRVPAIVPLVVATGLSEGTALLLLILMIAAPTPNWLSYLLAALIVARAVAWQHYYAKMLGANPPKATLEELRRINLTMLVAGVALPLILIFLPFGVPGATSALISAAAVLVVLTGWYMKFAIVTRAAHVQGFALARPRRAI